MDFVIIRCGYGSDYANQDDPQFEANVKKCQAAGIPWGTYLYSYAKTKAMAQSEAAHTLRLLQGRRPPYGVWYDVEDSSLPSGEALIDNVVAYCQALEAAGLYCGVYASLSWWEGRLNSPRLDRFDKWVAQWNSQLDYQGPVGLWQFTDRLMLNGKAFDGNWAYRDYPALTGEEEDTMTQAEVIALARAEAQKVYNENEAKYTLDRVFAQLGQGSGGAGVSGAGPGRHRRPWPEHPAGRQRDLYPRLDGDCQGAGEAGRPALAQAPGGNSAGGFWWEKFANCPGRLPKSYCVLPGFVVQ